MALRRNRGADRFRSPDPEWSAPLVHVREGKNRCRFSFEAGARVSLIRALIRRNRGAEALNKFAPVRN